LIQPFGCSTRRMIYIVDAEDDDFGAKHDKVCWTSRTGGSKTTSAVL
jgi:hypothetical protein